MNATQCNTTKKSKEGQRETNRSKEKRREANLNACMHIKKCAHSKVNSLDAVHGSSVTSSVLQRSVSCRSRHPKGESTFCMSACCQNVVKMLSITRILSRMCAIGHVNMSNTNMMMRTRKTDLEPKYKAYLEQTDCGRISPKITIAIVELKKPTRPGHNTRREM